MNSSLILTRMSIHPTLQALDAPANELIASNCAHADSSPPMGGIDTSEIISHINQDKELFQIISPGHTAAEDSLTLFWMELHNHLSRKPPTTIQDLDKVSSILHKVTSSGTQLNKIKDKLTAHFVSAPPVTQNSNDPLPPAPVSKEKVQKTKQRLTKALEEVHPHHHYAETAITASWKSIPRLLSKTPLPPLDDFIFFSNIIYKNASSYHRIKTEEIKLLDQYPAIKLS